MFPSRYLPCPECGDSLDRSSGDPHVCEEERRLDFLVFQRRGELASFEDELTAYLASPRGRFELFYAERERGTT
jgi:hypothetical protein